MTLSEKQMEKILSQDIQISDTVNERINDTYKMLQSTQENKQRPVRRSRRSYIAAAIAAVCCLVIPTAVYAAANTDFFDTMFGNTTKKSTEAFTKEIDNQKGGTTSVTIPSHEYVSVDPEKAKELVGDGALSEPIEKQLGDHTLCIENLVYDKNSAFMYFTLERKGGVTMLVGNEETNISKGAYFPDDSLWYFNLESTEGNLYYDNIYIDMEKSTEDKLYCSSYMIAQDALKDGEGLVLNVIKYPCPRSELPEEYELEEEKIPLTEEAAVSVREIDMGEDGYIEYSPLSIIVDLAKGMGFSEEEASDPISLDHLEIKYKDGTAMLFLMRKII